VEAALTTWFIDARARPISGPVLVQALQQHDFNATSGWLSRWKTRNNIVYKRLHGEKKDSDLSADGGYLYFLMYITIDAADYRR
jgi:hypothetical protein